MPDTLTQPAGAIARAQAHQRLASGDIEAAVQAHVQALSQEPSNRETAHRLFIALTELGHDAQAERLATALSRASEVCYQQQVEGLRLTPYIDFPRHVHLETLARCNARCTFCPSPTLARSGTRLDDRLIDKVITDLTDLPDGLPFQLSPFKVNEPFLDVRLFDILDQIEHRLPMARLTLTTNASPLTPKKLARLADYSSLNKMYVSFNDHRPEAYEATMGLSYARTTARLDALHAAVASGELTLRVVVSRVGDGSAHDDAFRLAVVRRWPLFGVVVMRRGDWLGQVDTPIADVPDVGCVRWFELSITATGTVAHCCMDGEAKWPLGEVSEHHLLEIYNQPSFRKLRLNAVSRHEAKPCNGCTFL